MSFSKHLQTILEELLIPDNKRSEYTKDAEEIQNYVIEELKRVDIHTFCQVFNGLSLGGSYFDRIKLNVPDEFDLHMKLKFPFDIIPRPIYSGFIYLEGNLVVAGIQRIHRVHLQDWLRNAFNKVFKTDITFTSNSGRVYKLKYTLQGYGCAHTIEAVSGSHSISFDMVPAFEFSGRHWPLAVPPVPAEVRENWPWFAIPQKMPKNKSRTTFMVCAPQWEREIMKDSDNLKNVLRLMKGLRDAHARNLPHLSSYMLKTVVLHRIASVDWQRDLGTLFVEMWSHLVDHLRAGRLEFFLAKDHNIFNRMNSGEIKKCLKASENLLQKLRNAQLNVRYFDLAELFDC
ncbi:LOW QUALITY PROTEIN: cyclic GMP-AMP synthase [Drosophila eugracilis]|uniref:LOW QUALITY PROTEIN: cyclic GMP-AMP synthase n=1 Tax=Drosophila eugracilis TaxID=29029 RepID=UPI0007E87EE3|nr:LOW QUALITY PROTEIN: cyclic GMP-AMP synthase [Drosophila eugracilis]